MDDEIDTLLNYFNKEQKRLTKRIYQKEEKRIENEFDRQLNQLTIRVGNFFFDKRNSLKALDEKVTSLKKSLTDDKSFDAYKLAVEEILGIILREIIYEPFEDKIGDLRVLNNKPLKLLTLQQKHMNDCQSIRDICVHNDRIYVIKWTSLKPFVVSTIGLYNLFDFNFQKDLGRLDGELTAIDYRCRRKDANADDGNGTLTTFYLADMTNNRVLWTNDCNEFFVLLHVEFPQGIVVCHDGLIIACDDPKTTTRHTVNMYKYSFGGQRLYHYEDYYRSLYKVCLLNNTVITTHDLDDEIMALNTDTNEKISILLKKGSMPIGACALSNVAFAVANHNSMTLNIYDKKSHEIFEMKLIKKPVNLAFYENNENAFLLCHVVD